MLYNSITLYKLPKGYLLFDNVGMSHPYGAFLIRSWDIN